MRDVLTEVAAETNYHFLYRDALVAGKRITFSAGKDELLDALDEALRRHDLRLQVDSVRKQVLVLEVKPSQTRSSLHLRGVVMDDESGARLPYATVTWREGETLRGTAANEAGMFDLRLESHDRAVVYLTVSYVGYRPNVVGIDLSRPDHDIPIRLVPEAEFGPEVLVSASALQTDVDTAWHHLLRAGVFSSLGESGVLRSLQTLPSVSVTPAVSPGINVRGSRADGFQVLLDGMSIYSQSHLFGLFDAFNEDVLQAVGLYYGIAPASLQGPPGGTMSFVTRTGSQRGVHGSLGASNTSGKATLEGPLFGGGGSWLISGRRSYLNAVDWFNSAGLIDLGLNVGRETSEPTRPVVELSDRALFPIDASAHFYDAHGKIYYEWEGGSRLMLNAYAGGDRTLSEAERLVNAPLRREPILQPADTENDWSNAAASIRLQSPVGSRAFSHVVAGFSRYRSDFSKDDFVYTDPTRTLFVPMDTSRHAIRPFLNENELLELKLAQRLDVHTGGTFSAGYALHRYGITYREESILRDSFDGTQRSTQLDLFVQHELKPTAALRLNAGVRSHIFSLGSFFRVSPRLEVRVFPERRVSIGGGYSRNYQFIHRLYVEHSTNADIWVMSTASQPPGSVDHVTAGVYVTALPTLYLQVEGYRKDFENLREHEASAARRRLRPASPLLDPWLHDNEGLARGIEAMARKQLGPILWTNSYTLSRMDLRNRRVNDGEPYPADWDRRHQFVSHLRISPATWLDAHVVWTYASGAPNALAHADPREPDRLAAYHRLDAGIELRRAFGPGSLQLRAAAFNLYDRSNTWYRSPIAVLGRSPEGRRVGLMNVDVYDLGFQPSFEVAYRF